MLLPRIVELKLLAEDSDSNILKDFPLESRINMIYQTNTYLNSNISQTSSTLVSASHVSWIMELVGKGFSLPMSEANIINGKDFDKKRECKNLHCMANRAVSST
jgi:hypothetical protein